MCFDKIYKILCKKETEKDIELNEPLIPAKKHNKPIRTSFHDYLDIISSQVTIDDAWDILLHHYPHTENIPEINDENPKILYIKIWEILLTTSLHQRTTAEAVLWLIGWANQRNINLDIHDRKRV